MGRLIEREPDKWRVLSYPAIAELRQGSPPVGEPLSPRFSLESRLEHKERIGEYLWSAPFQQKLVAQNGNLLKRYKSRYWQHAGMNLPPVTVQKEKGEVFEIVAKDLPSQFNRRIQRWDLAFEGEARSDYVAGLHVVTSGPKRYIVDTVHERMVEAFLFEVSAFPRGKNDDWLDAWTQAREVLSGAGVADSPMFTSEAVARLDRYLSPHSPIIPPGLGPWWDP